MTREQTKQVKKQTKKHPRTIEEKMNARDVFTFNKKYGTLKCKEKRLEIKEAYIGREKPGDPIKVYKVPFTYDQAQEICLSLNHGFAGR